jgi:hypothetical protein
LTQALSWRWCLYVNLVIAIPTAILALRLLQNVRLGQSRHLDLPGLLTGGVGLFALVYGVSNAETHSWTATITIVALAASAVLLLAFVLTERRVSQPLLPLGIPADRSRGGAFIALLLAFAGLFSVFLFLTFYLQRSLGHAPLLTGVAVLPLTAVTMIGATVAQIRLVPRIGVKPLVTVGMALAAIAMYSFTRLGVHSAYASHVLPGLIVTGLVESDSASESADGKPTRRAGGRRRLQGWDLARLVSSRRLVATRRGLINALKTVALPGLLG